MSMHPGGTVDYYEYIKSSQWRSRAEEAKRRAGYRCQVCNRSRSEVQLDAHHRTYERLGNERLDDITVLCRDCHELYERNRKLPSRPVRKKIDTPLSSSPGTEEGSTVSPSPYELIGSMPSQLRLVENDTHEKLLQDNKQVVDQPSKHLLFWLGAMVQVIGYSGNGTYLAILSWYKLWNNLIEFLNPFFYITVAITWVSTPLFWQLTMLTVVGYALMYASYDAVALIAPTSNVFSWYWRWSGTALVKVPLFLIYSVLGTMAIFDLLSTLYFAYYTSTDISYTSLFFIPSSVIRIYTSLLPVPMLHLIWDNRFKNNWFKLGISLVVIGLLFGASLLAERWAFTEQCMLVFDTLKHLGSLPPVDSGWTCYNYVSIQ